MTCTCIAEMDAKLSLHNTRIAVTLGFPRDGSPSFIRPTLLTEKIEPRKRGKSVIAVPTFCPFCGEPYEPQAAKAAT